MHLDLSYDFEIEEILCSKDLLQKVPRHQKGHDQILKILATTLELMVEKGYANFSYGDIASILSMAKGNIQYYFPSRDLLVRSAMVLQVEGAKREWLAAATKPASDRWQQLHHIIEWEIAHSRSAVKSALSIEKRAYAVHVEGAREIVNGFYRWMLARYIDVLTELRPDLQSDDLSKLAALLNAVGDGISPFFGLHRIGDKSLENFDQVLQREVRSLVENFGVHR